LYLQFNFLKYYFKGDRNIWPPHFSIFIIFQSLPSVPGLDTHPRRVTFSCSNIGTYLILDTQDAYLGYEMFNVGIGMAVALPDLCGSDPDIEFCGWCSDPDGKGTIQRAGSAYLVEKENAVLYGIWEPVRNFA